MKSLWILGAPDPEMEMIEKLLVECGESVNYAIGSDGNRVHSANAYRAIGYLDADGNFCDAPPLGVCCLVECDIERRGFHVSEIVLIDHHRPGDPGYGRPPEEFMLASSIGQVIHKLKLPDEWAMGVPQEYVFTAAADHCLGAAYRGECPGVDPDELFRWRIEQRAAFQGRSVNEVMENARATTVALLDADWVYLIEPASECYDPQCSCHLDHIPFVADMRRESPYPELVEAACRLDRSYIAGPFVTPDGRRKITCSGRPYVIEAFLNHWAPDEGLVDLYGDPARGFAGGYL